MTQSQCRCLCNSRCRILPGNDGRLSNRFYSHFQDGLIGSDFASFTEDTSASAEL